MSRDRADYRREYSAMKARIVPLMLILMVLSVMFASLRCFAIRGLEKPGCLRSQLPRPGRVEIIKCFQFDFPFDLYFPTIRSYSRSTSGRTSSLRQILRRMRREQPQRIKGGKPIFLIRRIRYSLGFSIPFGSGAF